MPQMLRVIRRLHEKRRPTNERRPSRWERNQLIPGGFIFYFETGQHA